MIKSKEGKISMAGSVSTLGGEFAVIALTLLEHGVPKRIIDYAVEEAYQEYKKRNKKENKDNFKKLLRNLGLED